jgi:uncharacterized protein GlcG (DUF336 family)
VGRVFFPLDEQLGLLACGYSPVIVETIVRLGTRLPFAVVAEEIALLFGVSVSADTVRRLTEEAGAVLAGIEQRELERLEHDAPEEPEGAAVQQVSADGCMLSLTNGRWTEVRTIAIGRVTQQEDGEVSTQELTYFSRHGSADAFIRQATLPTHERGTRKAETVAAVMDGASWLQELISEQCPDAVRILDFPHAASYLHTAADAAFGAESRAAAQWLEEWVPRFKSGEPEEILAALRALPTPTAEAATAKGTAIRYLGSRKEQIRYAQFQAQGLPIGSGIVESAGKLVVEARMKGSGMHWASRNLNPLLALRSRLCSGQWEQTWRAIQQRWRHEMRERQRQQRRGRQTQRVSEQPTSDGERPPKQPRDKTIRDGRPTPAHPWYGHRGIFAA